MKKLFALLVGLFLVGCDTGTNPVVVEKRDTVKIVDTSRKIPVVISDTVVQTIQRINISGRVMEKNASGNVLGAFTSVACLEKLNVCARSNKNGVYQILKDVSIKPLMSARKLSLTDTIQTEDSIVKPVEVPVPIKDIDTISITKDTVKILVNVYTQDTVTPILDTVKVYSADSRILYEQVVKTWSNILPDNYVVQRNISGYIYNNLYTRQIKKLEAVYWSADSIAMVIPLNFFKNTSSYSGFIYTKYNDSSFINDVQLNNVFVRCVDSADSVFGISNIVTYSERAGDLNTAFKLLVPGGVQRYPKPNSFAVLKKGDDVSEIVTNAEIVYVTNKKNIIDIDSIFSRNLLKKDSIHSGGMNTYQYYIDTVLAQTFSTNSVDSVCVKFWSDSTYSGFGYILQDRYQMNVDSGWNEFRTPYNLIYTQATAGKDGTIHEAYSVPGNPTNIQVKLIFK